MSNKLNVSIIYVNYNTQKLLENSLKSVVKNLSNLSYEIIVVDNNSNNLDNHSLRKIYPHIKIIKLGENLGFGRGNNEAAKVAKGKYLWLLNTDTLVPKLNNIETLVIFLENHTAYAATAPLLINSQDVIQPAQVAKFPSIWRMIIGKPVSLVIKFLPITRKILESIDPEYTPNYECDVDQAVAASLVVRKSVFDEVGGFSNEYFMFYEDTDLCKKIYEDGYKIRFIPSARVIHLHGGSIESDLKRKKMYFISQDKYFAKWKSAVYMIIAKVIRQPLVFYYWMKGLKSK